MKTNKIPCAVIKDLLPSYTEDLTSPETGALVRKHLEECPDCKALYDAMDAMEENFPDQGRANCGNGGNTEKLTVPPEIDYLKKIRAAGRKKIIAAVLAVVLVAGAAVLAKVYLYGSPIEDFHMTVSSQCAEAVAASTESEEAGGYEDFIIFSCWIEKSRGQAFTHYKIRETDEGKEILLYAAPASIFHKDTTMQIWIPIPVKTVNSNIYVEDLQESITIKGDTYGEHGWVTKRAKELYAARNPYIGDISADQAIANILGIGEKLGSYTSKLDTEEKDGYEYPYGWELIFDRTWKKAEIDANNEKMKNYGYALIALIDNCGEISWTYTGEDGESHTQSVTLADWAKEYPNDNINPGFRLGLKDYSKYDYYVQALIAKLDL